MTVVIEKVPDDENDRAKLDAVLEETAAKYLATGCCTVRRGGAIVAQVSGIGQLHCDMIANRMHGSSSWREGAC